MSGLSKDTAIKLTTALYYTPKGRSIQAEGIKPDVIIQSEYSDILDSWDVTEASLDHHIDNPNALDKNAKLESVPIIRPAKQIMTQEEIKAKADAKMKKMPKVADQSLAQVDLKNDFQLDWALNIIEGKPLPVESSTLAKSAK